MQKKSFDKSASIYDKNSPESSQGGNVPKYNKGHM